GQPQIDGIERVERLETELARDAPDLQVLDERQVRDLDAGRPQRVPPGVAEDARRGNGERGRIEPLRRGARIADRAGEVRLREPGVALEVANLIVGLERREGQTARELRNAADLPPAN